MEACLYFDWEENLQLGVSSIMFCNVFSFINCLLILYRIRVLADSRQCYFCYVSYFKHVLATLVISKALYHYLHFCTLLQIIFCVYIFVFLLLPLVEKLKPYILP